MREFYEFRKDYHMKCYPYNKRDLDPELHLQGLLIFAHENLMADWPTTPLIFLSKDSSEYQAFTELQKEVTRIIDLDFQPMTTILIAHLILGEIGHQKFFQLLPKALKLDLDWNMGKALAGLRPIRNPESNLQYALWARRHFHGILWSDDTYFKNIVDFLTDKQDTIRSDLYQSISATNIQDLDKSLNEALNDFNDNVAPILRIWNSRNTKSFQQPSV